MATASSMDSNSIFVSLRHGATRMAFLSHSPTPSPKSSVVKKDLATLATRWRCACSPSNHPGSFRCSFHKNKGGGGRGGGRGVGGVGGGGNPNRVDQRRPTRVRFVEGEWARRALAAMFRPSSSQQKRREAFRPKPSRLSAMSMARDDGNDLNNRSPTCHLARAPVQLEEAIC